MNGIRILLQSIVAWLLIVLLFSCQNDPADTIQVDFDYSTFLQKRTQWEELNIRNYNFTYSSHGFGCFANETWVRDNQIVNILPDTAICRFGISPNQAMTIDSIFAQIDYRYHHPIFIQESEDRYWYCYAVEIEYDPSYGFPSKFEFLQTGKNMYIEDIQSGQRLSRFSLQP